MWKNLDWYSTSHVDTSGQDSADLYHFIIKSIDDCDISMAVPVSAAIYEKQYFLESNRV